MTHEEFVSRLGLLTDTDAAEVLAHATDCASCASDNRRVDRALTRLEPQRRSLSEEVVRWATVAALLVVAVLGLRSNPSSPAAPEKAGGARYRIVGNASGVIAYTPGGIVMGTGALAPSREVLR